MIQALKLALKLWPQVLRAAAVWLVFLGVCALLLEEWVMSTNSVSAGSREPSMVLMLVAVTSTLLWSLVGNAMLVIVAARDGWQALSKKPMPTAMALMNEHLKPLTIESLRAMSWIFIWSFALVIPGIIKYLRYSYVAYVVLLDETYHRGERDALEHSSELTKGQMWALFWVNVGFFALTMALQALGQSFHWTLFSAPLQALVLQGVVQAVSLYWALVMFCLYWHKMENT